jgi:sulfite exporter TauE/SafE
MSIFLFLLASIGAAYIVGVSEISYPIRALLAKLGPVARWLVSLLECPVCFGVWWGFACGWWLNPCGLSYATIWNAIATALIVAGSNLVLARIGGLSVPNTGG